MHTGTHNALTLHPAPEDTGILFRRVDLGDEATVPVECEYVSRTDRSTVLKNGAVEVGTVEHLLAALRGLEIDNAYIDIDGPEVPIADGSSRVFVELIDDAGLVEQEKERRILTVSKPVWVRSGSRLAVALPYDGFKVSFTFTNDHKHPVLGDLFAEFDVTPESFREQIAPARTIGWLSEVESLKAKGLTLGATMEMAVVLSKDDILTPMRFPDEPVRHKILDVIGDLSVLGHMHAHIVALRSGHALNAQLARQVLSEYSSLR